MNVFYANKLRQTIFHAMQMFSTPAVSVSVIQNGEIIFSEGFGTRTLGKNESVDDQTSYAIASMSKSTVSASLAILHEQKAFDWEDPVSKYLPEFRLYDDFASKEIRALDLPIHNCGLRKRRNTGMVPIIRERRSSESCDFIQSVAEASRRIRMCFLAAGLIIQAITDKPDDL